MQTVLDPPVLLIQIQNALRTRFLSRKIRHAIGNFFSFFFSRLHPSANLKHLREMRPFVLEPFIHLRTRPNFPHFSPSMTLLHLLVVSPFSPIERLVGKKVLDILAHRWLIVFHRQKVISSIGMNSCTPFLLGMYRICTDDSPLHQEWV